MNDQPVFYAHLLEEEEVITLAELCRSCALQTETIKLLVEEGVLDPLGETPAQWCFTVNSLRRVSTVIHLQRDLGVNLPGAALALDLLDEIAQLKRRSIR